MRSYVLDELQAKGVPIACTQYEAAVVAETELVEMRPQSDGTYLAVPNRNIGAVRVGDLQIEVKPKGKVGVRQVLFFLGYARDPGFRAEDVHASSDDQLLPAIAESLVRQSQRALAGGPYRGYVQIDESGRTVRGRIRIGDQIARRPGLMFPIEVSYDDYSIDVAENRLLRSALRRVSGLPRLPQEMRRLLRALDAQLEGAHVLERGEPFPRWVPTRLNSRYHAALRLAELILRNQVARVGAGGVEIAAFVVPMWKVFEDFVGIAFAEAMKKYSGAVTEQYQETLDVPQYGVPTIDMAVDIVYEVDRRPVFVADAKYKAASTSGQYPNADKYQMLAYCTALGVDRAYLVYAQGGEDAAVRSVRNADITITDWPLDLSQSPRKILGRVSELADLAFANADVDYRPWRTGQGRPRERYAQLNTLP